MDEKREILEHLDELRSRALVIFGFFIVFAVIGFFLSGPIINQIRSDLFPAGMDVEMIATYPMEFLITKINVGVFFGILACIPVLLLHFISFVKPAMTREEMKTVKYVIPAGLVLFVTGLAFSYFLLLKVGVWFLAGLAYSAGVSNLWNVNYFILFVFLTSVLMGMVFQLPVVTFIMTRMGIIDTEFMKEKRGYVIVAIFIIAALISPPDPVTQVLVGIPMVILFEISVIVSKAFS